MDTPQLQIIRALKRYSPVLMGVIAYFVCSRFVGLETWVSALIGFAIAVSEWFAFSVAEKAMMRSQDD